tara:strand:- start:9067 stop:9267 length:201 start_codon:yes stop_codon:yes gene_type:complete
MGVQKNIGRLKAQNQVLLENLKKLIIQENDTRELAIGTLEILKLLPGYEEAIKQLKERVKDGHKGD